MPHDPRAYKRGHLTSLKHLAWYLTTTCSFPRSENYGTTQHAVVTSVLPNTPWGLGCETGSSKVAVHIYPQPKGSQPRRQAENQRQTRHLSVEISKSGCQGHHCPPREGAPRTGTDGREEGQRHRCCPKQQRLGAQLGLQYDNRVG